MEKIRGVNLGNWLVLEKWMSPSVFSGTTAEDETELCRQLSDEKHTRLKVHRDSYITLSDFQAIKNMGLNMIRLPVPHFVFDDCEPYAGCIGYVDKAFEWAESAGLSDYMKIALRQYTDDIIEMQQYFPVVVGEWSLAHYPHGQKDFSALKKQYGYRAMADAQLFAWENVFGWFFWSYKLEPEVEGWDLRKCVEKGWFPRNFETGI